MVILWWFWDVKVNMKIPIFGKVFPSVPLIKPSMLAVVALSWPVSCYTVVRSVVLSSSLAMHKTRLIEKDCNSCLQWVSVTCPSKRLHIVLSDTTAGWASTCRGLISLCLSSILCRHFCCCVRRLNVIPSLLLMRRRWTWNAVAETQGHFSHIGNQALFFHRSLF